MTASSTRSLSATTASLPVRPQWLAFHQKDVLAPDLPIVIDHRGSIVRIGVHEQRRKEDFDDGSKSIHALARLPDVVVKLGGLGMRINGVGFERLLAPPTSIRLAQAWAPWMQTCIEAFGAERCMFESNFPVDKGSHGDAIGWNAFKRLSGGASAHEKRALCEGTASRVYRLG